MIIKFRAKYKNKEIKNWAYGSLVESEWDIRYFRYKLSEFFNLLEQGFLDPATVGIFIGKKDKNATEIYTGDELDDGFNSIIGGIVFQDEDGQFCEENFHAQALPLSDTSGRLIIGNIYEEKKENENEMRSM